MKIGEYLFFAPDLCFADLDFDESKLPSQYKERIDGFYLKPAEGLANQEHGFGAGLLVLCAIDALGMVDFPQAGSKKRFKKYIKTRLPSLKDYATEIYDIFRCGIAHEARAKKGAEISLQIDDAVEPDPGDSGIILNPRQLALNVRAALDSQMNDIRESPDKAREFKDFLLRQFSVELAGVDTG